FDARCCGGRLGSRREPDVTATPIPYGRDDCWPVDCILLIGSRHAWGTADYPVSRSDELFAAANRVIPGGVNSPVRAFRAVGGTPPFIASGQGAYVRDVDGRTYLDYVQSWGALLFGHAR